MGNEKVLQISIALGVSLLQSCLKLAVGGRKINQNIFTLWGVAGGRRKINQNIFYSLSGESSDIFLKTRSY
jgi:hypothetical protein